MLNGFKGFLKEINIKQSAFVLCSYLLLGIFAFSSTNSKDLVLIWPPIALSISLYFIYSKKFLPEILLGHSLIFYLYTGSIITTVLSLSGLVLNILLANHIMKKIIDFNINITRLKDAIGLSVIISGGSTVIFALFTAFAVWLTDSMPNSNFADQFSFWWTASFLGILVFAPPIFIFHGKPYELWEKPDEKEIYTLLSVLVFTGIFLFSFDYSSRSSLIAASYIPLGFAVWSVLRYGPGVTSLVSLFVVLISIIGTFFNGGPFINQLTASYPVLLFSTLSIFSFSSLIFVSVLAEKRQASKILIEEEERQIKFLQAIPDLVYRCNREGLTLDVHAKRSKDLVAPIEDIIGRNIFDFMTEDISLKIKYSVELAMKTKETHFIEYENVKNGIKHVEEAKIVPSGKDEYFLVIRDITAKNESKAIISQYVLELQKDKSELKRYAAELSKLNKRILESESELKKTNAQKDMFFSIIAHDLRSPFTSLLTYSEYLSQNLRDLSMEEIAKYSDSIYKSTNNLFRLVENLLQWSRIQSGRVEFDPMKFNITALTNATVNILETVANEKQIRIRNNCQEKVTVYADMNMIETVIRNLISNSIKFTNTGGQIVIDIKNSNQNVEVNVSDNGVGIKEEDMKRLFKIDERLTTQGTQNEKGTGLGLILCKDFIEKNSGQIWVESKYGEGTTFKFLLPAQANNN